MEFVDSNLQFFVVYLLLQGGQHIANVVNSLKILSYPILSPGVHLFIHFDHELQTLYNLYAIDQIGGAFGQ